ncbi:hypothetical protein JIN77_02535 [Verrucomicrobiaceae bacterium R5-34]|nr:hypothetical protein [Verrucomicrobiaceae bacterium R5-34]
MKTTWIDGDEDPSHYSLNWSVLALVDGIPEAFRISIGRDQKGRITSYALSGVIANTARNLHAELGWRIENSKEVTIPIISPKIWSETWKTYVEGDCDEIQLIEALLPDSSKGTIKLTPPPARGRPPYLLATGIALAALGVGFALAWNIKPTPKPQPIPACEDCLAREHLQQNQPTAPPPSADSIKSPPEKPNSTNSSKR